MDDIIATQDIRILFMKQVYQNAAFSKDPKTKIGAVLVLDKYIISSGFNGFPRGVKDLRERYENRDIKHSLVCHAEANAVLTAARLGRATLGSTLYTQGIPCSECCKSLIQAGVKKFVLHQQWPNLTHSLKWVNSVALSKQMMEEAGVEYEFLDVFLGMSGLLDGQKILV